MAPLSFHHVHMSYWHELKAPDTRRLGVDTVRLDTSIQAPLQKMHRKKRNKQRPKLLVRCGFYEAENETDESECEFGTHVVKGGW